MEPKVEPKIIKNHAPNAFQKTSPKNHQTSSLFQPPRPSWLRFPCRREHDFHKISLCLKMFKKCIKIDLKIDPKMNKNRFQKHIKKRHQKNTPKCQKSELQRVPKWSQNPPKNYPEAFPRPFWPPGGRPGAPGTPKCSKIIKKSSKNDSKMMPKWFQNDPTMIPKWSQNDPKMMSKWS